MAEIELSTVDAYQGEENDIVLLSLVRSNEQGALSSNPNPNPNPNPKPNPNPNPIPNPTPNL